jgi:predicted dehydrogenase
MPERRVAVRREFGVVVPETLEAAWDVGPEIVIVATPPQDHVALAGEAVKRGCGVFVEKPLAHRLDGVAELCAAVDPQRVLSMVACNMRFHPGPAAIKALLERGTVGVPIAARLYTGSYLPRWRPGQDYRTSYSASPEGGGAVLDCIHELDLALWYFGPARVRAAAVLPATSLGLKVDGLAEILLQHASGALSSIHLNFVQRNYRRCCQIVGEKGTLAWDFETREVRRYDQDGSLTERLPEPSGWELNQMYVDEMRHFLEAAESDQSAVNPIREAAVTLRLALESRARGVAAC